MREQRAGARACVDGSREKERGERRRREKRKGKRKREKRKGKGKEKGREREKERESRGIFGSDHGVGRAHAVVGRHAAQHAGRREEREGTAIDFGAGSAGSPGKITGNLEFGQEGV